MCWAASRNDVVLARVLIKHNPTAQQHMFINTLGHVAIKDTDAFSWFILVKTLSKEKIDTQ